MISHNMTITSIKTEDIDSQQKVVVYVGWRLSANNGEREVSFDGQSIWDKPSDEFTPFEQLTEAQVTQWIESGEPLDNHRLSLEQQLSFTEPQPQSSSQEFPWAGA